MYNAYSKIQNYSMTVNYSLALGPRVFYLHIGMLESCKRPVIIF